MKRIVLTGNIASGKSTVVTYLKENHGIIVLEEDKLSKEIFFKHYEELCELFQYQGEDLRSYLAENVFKDKEMLTKLENFLYPFIYEIVNYFKDKYPDSFYVFDSALFFEKYERTEKDFVILITIPYEIQLKRLMERNNYDEQTAIDRINSQMPVEEKIKLSDIVIENTGSKEDLFKKIDELLDTLIYNDILKD